MNSHYLLTADERLHLDPLYVPFVTSLDAIPPFLRDDQLVTNAYADRDEIISVVRLYTVSAANLYASPHRSKMAIMLTFEETSYYPMGDNEMLLLRKTENAGICCELCVPCVSYLLRKLEVSPVENLRLIGASFLEVIDQHEASPLFPHELTSPCFSIF